MEDALSWLFSKVREILFLDDRAEVVCEVACLSLKGGRGRLSEDIRVASRVEEKEAKLCVVLFPYEQPVRLNMALPLTSMIAGKLMRLVGVG